MKRLRLKRTFKVKKYNRLNILVLSFVFIVVGLIFVFRYVNAKASPIIMEYASLEAQKLSSIIINKAISTHITENISTDDLFEITYDESGEIKAIDFNTVLVNKFLTETTNSVQVNLQNIEKGNVGALEFSDSVLENYDEKKLEQGIIYEISSGLITGNALLANIGPKIPVKISLVGDAVSNISTEVTNYGINNAMIEVFVNLKITEKVMLPFYNESIEIESRAPVALKIVTGTVPKYYANGLTQNTPSVVVPTED